MPVIHVEMYDSRTFCGDDGDRVYQGDWHDDPGAVATATCLVCLDRIHWLGHEAAQARRALEASGATRETQAAEILAEDRERDRARRGRGDKTATLASVADILKQAYNE